VKFRCKKCNKFIFFKALSYSGNQYCLDCYKLITKSDNAPQQTTLDYSEHTEWIMKNCYLVKYTGIYYLDTDTANKNYTLTIYHRKQELYTIRLHKLFTYTYGNSDYRIEVVLNAADGVPFLVTFGYDGGADGDGEYLRFQKLTYEEFHMIIKNKNKQIQQLFENLTEDTWRDYITVYYYERQKASAVYYVAAMLGSVTRIAVSFQSNPTHQLTYVECSTADYLAWKKKHTDLFDSFCSYPTLSDISSTYLSAKHSPLHVKKYSYFPNKAVEGGNIDLVISRDNTTKLFVYESLQIDNAIAFIDLVETTCKKKNSK